MLRKINEKPENCIFIDDKESNIQVSESIGMKGILYTNNGDLRVQLKEHDIVF